MPTPNFVQAIRQWSLTSISIRLRLALWYGTLLFVTLTLFSIIVFAVARIQLEISVDQGLQSRASIIANNIQGELLAAQNVPSSVTPVPTNSPARTTSSTASPGGSPPTTTPFATPVPTVDPAEQRTIQGKLELSSSARD